MEMPSVNNAFLGLFGGVSASASAEQTSTQADGTPDFFTMLQSIMGVGCLKGESPEAQSATMIEELSIPASTCSAGPAQLENASVESTNNAWGRDAGGLESVLLANLPKEQTAETENTNSLEIDFRGVSTASIKVLDKFIAALSDALRTTGKVSLSVEQTAGDQPDEKIVPNTGSQLSPDTLSGIDEKKEVISRTILPLLALISESLSRAAASASQKTGKDDHEDVVPSSSGTLKTNISGVIEPGLFAESVLAAQLTNDRSVGTSQLLTGKEEERASLHAVGRATAKRIMLTLGGKDSNSDSLLQVGVENESDNKVADKIEVLLRNLTDMAGRKGVKNNDTLSSDRPLMSADAVGGSGNGIAARALLHPEEKVLTETVVKRLEDITEPQAKDLKVSSRENEYIPFSKNENPDRSFLQDAQTHGVGKENAFSALMAEKIERIVEQFSAKGRTMDMILRLKIDDRETLLVGFKNEGQKVMVDVKASNEGVVNILQTHKDAISRNLEEKHVYTNIYVDPDANGSFERRESRRDGRRREQDSSDMNFIEFLEASA